MHTHINASQPRVAASLPHTHAGAGAPLTTEHARQLKQAQERILLHVHLARRPLGEVLRGLSVGAAHADVGITRAGAAGEVGECETHPRHECHSTRSGGDATARMEEQ